MTTKSTIVSVRMGPTLIADIQDAIRRKVWAGVGTKQAMGDWIRQACVEKLNHLDRSVKPKKTKFKCQACRMVLPVEKIAYTATLIGETKSKAMCKVCESNGHVLH